MAKSGFEQSERVLDAVRSGSTLREACEQLGVNERTCRTWMRRRPDFGADVKAALRRDVTTVAPAPVVAMTIEELEDHLAALIRSKRSVEGMRLWLQLRPQDQPSARPSARADGGDGDFLDELTARRERRAGA